MATRHFIQLVNEQLPKSPIIIEPPAHKNRADECAKYVERQIISKPGSETKQSTKCHRE